MRQKADTSLKRPRRAKVESALAAIVEAAELNLAVEIVDLNKIVMMRKLRRG